MNVARVEIPETSKAAFREELWNDLCSEFDSVHFYAHVKANASRFSDDFLDFLEHWQADEERHARGFLKLYQTAFGETEGEIVERLRARPVSFDELAWFFEDEFRLCLLVAYDELATTVSYHLDREFYRSIGGAELERWISGVKADEGRHFQNLIKLLRKRHARRFLEAPAILARVLSLDLEKESYDGTFVLDHVGEPFTPELLKDCVRRILNKVKGTA